jgi:hypothetical protein
MDESSAVAVGLDVHANSIRLAAVRGDELLDERTLAYDLEAVARCLRRWPGVRCCYEAEPTGFDLYRYLREGGIACEVVAPGLVPERVGVIYSDCGAEQGEPDLEHAPTSVDPTVVGLGCGG